MCGENPKGPRRLTPASGSSPRVRGKREFVRLSHLRPGLIPACAGKTSGEAGDEKGSTAHPRVCGENSCQRAAPLQRWGSSPRVRGKREECAGEAEGRGLIPACAGKTLRHRVRGRMRRAHPRVCGENMFRLGTGPTWGGSSPRVRGKHLNRQIHSATLGLIPACAGKTEMVLTKRLCLWAHPRVCGENRNDP